MRRMHVAAAGALALAGCGGDGGGASRADDERAIRTVIERNFTREEPREECRERLSEEFVKRSYGTRDACEKILKNSRESRERATGVRISRLTVDDDRASAQIVVSGGSADGLTGGVDVIREDDAWRIDDFDAALARSLVELSLIAQSEDLPDVVVRCVREKAQGLPEDEARRIAFGLVGGRTGAARELFHVSDECEVDGVPAQRALAEQGMVEGLTEEGATRKQADCVISQLRRRVGDDEFIDTLAGGEQAVAKLVTPYIERCL